MVSVILIVAIALLWQETTRLKKRLSAIERGDPRMSALELRMDLLSRRAAAAVAAPTQASSPEPEPRVAPERETHGFDPLPETTRRPVAAESSESPAPRATASVRTRAPSVAFSEENPWKAPLEAGRVPSDGFGKGSIDTGASVVDRVSRGGFEDLFGRRLPIWAGGITLAIAGMLIVRLSIESGFLTPFVRVVLSALFGGALIAGAEFVRSLDVDRHDPRVPQALAGAGIATLYGVILMASLGYDMMGQGAAFACATLVTIGAGALSMRFGPASALLGLVGGMVAPTLVGVTQDSVPLLAVYVSLVVGGLGLVAKRQGWWWLSALSMAAGLLWITGLLIHAEDPFASFALAAMIGAIAFGTPLLVRDEGPNHMRLIGSIVGSVQMAALVAAGGFGALQWGLYGLLSALVVWMAACDHSLRRLPALGLAISFVLVTMWDPSWSGLLAVLAGIVAIYGASSTWRAWAHDDVEAAWTASATGILVSFAAITSFLPQEGGPAAVTLVASLLLVIGAFVGWTDEARTEDSRFSSMIGTAAVLAFVACWRMFGFDVVSVSSAVLSIGLVTMAREVRDRRISWWGVGLVVASVLGSIRVLGTWAFGGVQALAGDAFTSAHAPALFDAMTMLVPAIAAVGYAAWRIDMEASIRRAVLSIAGVMGLVLAHTVWKRTVGSLFASEGSPLAYLDRTVWEVALAGLAALFVMRGRRLLALVAGGAAMLHFAAFSLLIESPLVQAQFVGPVLAVSFALMAALVFGSRRLWTGDQADQARAFASIALISAYAFLQLRQLVNGDMLLSSGTTGTEEIIRSLLAVGLGIGFLAWGLVRSDRTWRIASLGMMLFAAVKVFVFDAAGLDGIARIGTFVALGFSLIGIGWVYSRYLPERKSGIVLP